MSKVSNATGQSYNKWTSDTSKKIDKEGAKYINSNKESNNFIVSNNEVGSTEYYGDFVNFTRSYIGEYDTDKDGAISFDEFVEKETALAKKQGADVPDEAALKQVFDRLNIIKEGDNAKNLSEKEVFSYFMGLDAFDEMDGQISVKEFFGISAALQDPSNKPDGFGAQAVEYLKAVYNKIFG